MDEIDRQVAGEIENIRASIKAQYDAARAQETLLTSRIGVLSGEGTARDTTSRVARPPGASS